MPRKIAAINLRILLFITAKYSNGKVASPHRYPDASEIIK